MDRHPGLAGGPVFLDDNATTLGPWSTAGEVDRACAALVAAAGQAA